MKAERIKMSSISFEKCYCCDEVATTTSRVSEDYNDMYGSKVPVCEKCKYNLEEKREEL